ncbi:MAG: response regulator transcription factor [Candidatus Aminicenantes bacterium]|nr:response regulator transcription factor [Candidatus Aminicenantes bacterium]
MIKVLIADDYPVVREGLKKIFSGTNHIVVAGEAENGQELLERIKDEDFNVVLLDITMPNTNWLEVLKELKRRIPKVPVVILSMHRGEEYVTRAFKAGASGYLTKESMLDELVQAVDKVVEGRKYISPAIAESLVSLFDTEKETPPHKLLSDREYEVMSLMVKGKKPKEIARELFLSPNTVNTYRARILEKTKTNNIAELVHYAIKNNLIE